MEFRKICHHPFLFKDGISLGGFVDDKLIRTSNRDVVQMEVTFDIDAITSLPPTIRQDSRTALPSQTTRAGSQKKKLNAWYKTPRSTRPRMSLLLLVSALRSGSIRANLTRQQEQAQDCRQRGDFLVRRFARGKGGIRHDETMHNATVGEGCHTKRSGNPRNELIPHKSLFVYSFRYILTNY